MGLVPISSSHSQNNSAPDHESQNVTMSRTSHIMEQSPYHSLYGLWTNDKTGQVMLTQIFVMDNSVHCDVRDSPQQAKS